MDDATWRKNDKEYLGAYLRNAMEKCIVIKKVCLSWVYQQVHINTIESSNLPEINAKVAAPSIR